MIVFNGREFDDFGVIADNTQIFERPVADYTEVKVPGRNGTLRISNDRYENVNIPVECWIPRGFQNKFSALCNFLQQDGEYHRFENSSEPDHYRMASASVDGAASYMWHKLGKFVVNFNCRPEKWLKSGEITKTYTADATIYNPTLQAAKPMLRVYGHGSFSVGSQSFTLAEHKLPYVDIDSDIQDAFYESTNCNGFLTLNSGYFPTLSPGMNGIQLGDGIEKIELTPRWFEL